MSEFWKNQNLDGNGLQTINQQYSKLKRESKTAYFLCLLFPIGAHQFYLKASARGAIYIALSICIFATLNVSPLVSAALLTIEIILLIVDIKNTDDQVVAFNKKLKMHLSLQSNSAAPKGFKGRYHDDTPIDDYLSIKANEITAFETEKSAIGKPRIYSFDEQEKLLREMNKMKEKGNEN